MNHLGQYVFINDFFIYSSFLWSQIQGIQSLTLWEKKLQKNM